MARNGTHSRGDDRRRLGHGRTPRRRGVRRDRGRAEAGQAEASWARSRTSWSMQAPGRRTARRSCSGCCAFRVDDHAPTGPLDALRMRLRAQLRAVLANDPGTRLGRDPESLHDMRVAVRRSRALLRAGQPLYANDMSGLTEELRWVGEKLGAVRDLDVLLERLRAETEDLDPRRSRSLSCVAANARAPAHERAHVAAEDRSTAIATSRCSIASPRRSTRSCPAASTSRSTISRSAN